MIELPIVMSAEHGDQAQCECEMYVLVLCECVCSRECEAREMFRVSILRAEVCANVF